MTGHQAHSLHLSDPVGTFNERCPDCNNSYYQAVEAVLALHQPTNIFSTDGSAICNVCNAPGGGNVAYPCPTVRAIRNAGATEPETLLGRRILPREAPSEAGLKRCQSRRYPSGNEKCGLFLIGGLCVHHGRDTGV